MDAGEELLERQLEESLTDQGGVVALTRQALARNPASSGSNTQRGLPQVSTASPEGAANDGGVVIRIAEPIGDPEPQTPASSVGADSRRSIERPGTDPGMGAHRSSPQRTTDPLPGVSGDSPLPAARPEGESAGTAPPASARSEGPQAAPRVLAPEADPAVPVVRIGGGGQDDPLS